MYATKLRLLAGNLRLRAEEALAQGETMRDVDARQKMRDIAVEYEKLAQRVEQTSTYADEA